MYFLDRLRPELSSNEDGTSPNEKFHELYAKVKAGESIVTYSLNQLPLAV
jgi:hypothetical protein